jgi:uncharacterized protein (DUF2384 family)
MLHNLNDKQQAIIANLRAMFDTEEELMNWLSVPNKLFRGRPPIDVLNTSNYDYFERLFDKSN